MGNEWSQPDWKSKGRYGPGPFAPKVKKTGNHRKSGLCGVIALGIVLIPLLFVAGAVTYFV